MNYYLLALKCESIEHLERKTDELKDIARRENYRYVEENSSDRIMIYSVNNNSIQLLIKTHLVNDDIKVEEFQSFIEELNVEKIDILYKKLLSETLTNEMILDMKRKREFDLITAVEFSIAVKEKITREIENRDKDDDEDDYGANDSRLRNRNIGNRQRVIDKEVDKDKLDEIVSTVKLDVSLSEEIEVLKKLCNTFRKGVDYFIKIEHEDLNEIEIAKTILSAKYSTSAIKMKDRTYIMTLNELVNPPNFFKFKDEGDEIKVHYTNLGMSLIISKSEELVKIDEKQMNKLLRFMRTKDISLIFVIDLSRVENKEKLNLILKDIEKQTIYRKIEVAEISELQYLTNIKKDIKKLGYELNDNIDSKKFIADIKKLYGEHLKVSNIKLISELLVFKHLESSSNEKVIDNVDFIAGAKEDAKADEVIKTGLEMLESMIGLTEVKSKVREFIEMYRINERRKELGLKAEKIAMHMVLKGNAGTGKTTFARILAQILREEGIMEKGECIEVSLAELIEKYVGWTSKNIVNYFEKTKGSVLFIDEAYLLSTDMEKGFGAEAVGTLVKCMEDYRDEVVVILAGYPDEMDKLVNSNPGMKSRIGLEMTIEDYNVEELLEIFRFFCREREYTFSKEVQEQVREHLQKALKNKDEKLGNARYVRKLVERIFLSQSSRVSKIDNATKNDLLEITEDDVRAIAEDTDLNIKSDKIRIGFIR